MINQVNDEGVRDPIRFRAKVLNDRKQKYAQVKRELWGIITAIKTDREYLIRSGGHHRNGLLAGTWDDAVLHDSGRSNAKVGCVH